MKTVGGSRVPYNICIDTEKTLSTVLQYFFCKHFRPEEFKFILNIVTNSFLINMIIQLSDPVNF